MKTLAQRLPTFGGLVTAAKKPIFSSSSRKEHSSVRIENQHVTGDELPLVINSAGLEANVSTVERDLCKDPMCRPEDLGKSIPPTPYGVSVCLPLWEHVIGYEEGSPEILKRFQSGYPRFYMPKAIERLVNELEKLVANEGERALVFPRLVHARRCAAFVEQREKLSSRTIEWGEDKLGICVFPESAYKTARLFWRLSGEIVSSRQAESILNGITTAGSIQSKEGERACLTIKQRLAELTGQTSEDIFLFPSGMAASFAVHRMLTSIYKGRKTVQLDFPYVDLLKVQQNFGAGVHFLSTGKDESAETIYDKLRGHIKDEPLGGLFLETPSNPLLRCLDVDRVRNIREEEGKAHDLPIILDDTVTSCLTPSAFQYADLVVTSLTKAFSGAGDVLAGSIILNATSPYRDKFADFLKAYHDNSLWCGDAIVLERNSRDFEDRAKKTSQNGEALYEFLVKHPAVEEVFYPKSEGTFIKRFQPRGGCCGPLLSIVLKDPETKSEPFYNALRVSKGPSLGTNFTLVCPYTLLAHYDELEFAEESGVSRYLIRISVGLEDSDDLIARFKEALEV